MSENVRSRCLRPELRLEKIKVGLLEGKTWIEIAEECNCNERTIRRDFKKWYKSDDYEAWLYERHIILHGKMERTDPATAYREITKLIAKRLVEKRETELRGSITIKGYGLGEKQPTADG